MIGTIKKSLLTKFLSVFLVFSFAFTSTGTGYAAVEDTLGGDARNEFIDAVIPVDDIGIAIDCGTIKSKYQAEGKKVIVHIQDAHCNYEAQQNINKMLDQLVNECGVRMISVEGAEGIVDTSWFKAFPDAEIRKEVATYFMKKGEITGAEFFSITSDYTGTIYGAETRENYIRNLKAFTRTYPYKTIIENYFQDLQTITNRLKGLIYPARLKELDLKIRNFESKELELSDFTRYLVKCVNREKLDVKKYANFSKLVDTLEYEDKIDFDIVDEERSQYIDLLSKKMSKEDMGELVTMSIRFKKGHLKPVEFYTYLREQAEVYNIPIVHDFKNLFYYYIYTKLYDGINNELLFKEIDELERTLKDRLFTSDVQRKLDNYSEMIGMYLNLVNIELTNDDYDLFEEYSKNVTVDDIVRFLSGLSSQYNLSYSIGEVPVQISENLPNMIDFYEIAMIRDRALIDNTLKEMDRQDKNICVLIAGGFHTRGMKRLLEKGDVSYVVVMPKITKDVETPYIKVLTNQRTSLEDIITENAVPSNTMSMMQKGAAIEAKGDMLAPLSRIAMMQDFLLGGEARQALVEMSRDIGSIEGLEDADVISRAEEFTKSWVSAGTGAWLDGMLERLQEEEPENWQQEWNRFMTDEVLQKIIINLYLNKTWDATMQALLALEADTAAVEVTPGTVKAVRAKRKKICDSLRQYMVQALTEGFEARSGGQPGPGEEPESGGVHATGTVLNNEQSARFNEILEASFDRGSFEEVKRNDIRKGFQFVLHDGLAQSLLDAGLPVNVHPGRGGARFHNDLIQAHIDKDVYNELARIGEERGVDYLGILARHELDHLDIFSVNQVAREMARRNEIRLPADGKGLLPREETLLMRAVKRRYSIRQTVVAQEMVATWLDWVKHKRPLGDAQEEYVNNVRGHDTSEIAVLIHGINEDRIIREAGIEGVLSNIELARKVGLDLAVLVSGSRSDAESYGGRLAQKSRELNIKRVISLVEQIGEKTREGNFLGTLLAYKKIKKILFSEAVEQGVPNPEQATKEKLHAMVVLVGMIFGQGERMSPYTQLRAVKKPSIDSTSPKYGEDETVTESELSAIEEAMLYFTPVAAYLKAGGWTGFLDKWGDETEIPSVDIQRLIGSGVTFEGFDIIKVVQVMTKEQISEEHAIEKDWVLADKNGNMLAQIARAGKVDNPVDVLWDKITETARGLGLEEGEFQVGVSLGPAGLSFEVLDIAEKVFEEEIHRDGIYFDFDPYLLMAVAMKGDEAAFLSELKQDTKLQDLAGNPELAGVLRAYKPEEGMSREGLIEALEREVTDKLSGDEWDSVKRFQAIKAGLLDKEGMLKERFQHMFADELKDFIVKKAAGMVPDFFEKVNRIRNAFQNGDEELDVRGTGREMKLKILDLGARVYWADIGQHGAMYDKYMAVNDKGAKGIIARKIENIPGMRDANGNIIINSTISPDVTVRDSVIINSNITGSGVIESSVVKDSTLNDVEINEAFVVKSYRTGRTVLNTSGLYRSYGTSVDELALEEGGRHGTLLSLNEDGTINPVDLQVHESTDLRDVENTFNRPLVDDEHGINNPISFAAARDIMKGVSLEELDRRHKLMVEYIRKVDRTAKGKKAAKMGTSGLRGVVTADRPEDVEITPLEVYINFRAQFEYAKDLDRVKGLPAGYLGDFIRKGKINIGDILALAGDRRPSTVEIARAIALAALDSGLKVDFQGLAPSPAIANYGINVLKMPSVMVTASHTPDNMQGAKTDWSIGELLKPEEPVMRPYIAKVRRAVYAEPKAESYFDQDTGAFKPLGARLPEEKARNMAKAFAEVDLEGVDRGHLYYRGNFISPEHYNRLSEFQKREVYSLSDVEYHYVRRYTDAFIFDNVRPLEGMKLVFYQQSAVGRDLLPLIYEALGAEVIREEKSETFVAIDSEDLKKEYRDKIKSIAAKHNPFAVITTDGDSDRPVFCDNEGNFLHGDKLGALTSLYLGLDFAAVTASTNSRAIKLMRDNGIKVKKTKIGSPYVIKAMLDEGNLPSGKGKRGAFEVNGGFLLGADLMMQNGSVLKALPTRDAVLPMLSALLFAQEKIEKTPGYNSVQDVINGTFSGEYEAYTPAGLVENVGAGAKAKVTPGCEVYTRELGPQIIRAFSPSDGDIEEVIFGKTVDIEIRYSKMEEGSAVKPAPEIRDELSAIKEALDKHLATMPELAGQTVARIEYLDGVRIFLTRGDSVQNVRNDEVIEAFAIEDIVHLRPSGNAAQFRMYSESSSEEQAEKIIASATRPNNGFLVRLIQEFAERSSMEEGVVEESPGLYSASRSDQARLRGQVIKRLKERLDQGRFIKFLPSFRTADEGYKWGKGIPVNFILELMGAVTEGEKMALAGKLGVPLTDSEGNPNVISESWLIDGLTEEGLEWEALSGLFGHEIFGEEHLVTKGAQMGITAKVLTSGEALSLQYHHFPEMIIPMKKGKAYIGLKQDVTKARLKRALDEGTIHELLNEVDLEAGKPYIIRAGVLHAYNLVDVYEVKAVSSALDKVGTVSFYDRLKYSGTPQMRAILDEVARVKAEKPNATYKDISEALKSFQTADGRKASVRPRKDVLTLPKARVDEIIDEIAQTGNLRAINPGDLAYNVETLREIDGALHQIMGEVENSFITERYLLRAGAQIESNEVTVGRPHSLFVRSGKTGTVRIIYEDGVEETIRPGEQVLIPATAGRYTIKAVKTSAEVYTQYAYPADMEELNLQTPEQTDSYQVESGERQELMGEEVLSYETSVVCREIGASVAMVDHISVNSTAKLPEVIGERPFSVRIIKGGLRLALPDNEVLAVDGTPVTFQEGTTVFISGKGIEDSTGRAIPLPEGFPLLSLRLINPEELTQGSVEVDVEYEKTDAEKVIYGAFEKVNQAFERTEDLADRSVVLLYPEQMFAGETGPGSRAAEEDILNSLLRYQMAKRGASLEDIQKVKSEKRIRIVTFDASVGLEAAETALREQFASEGGREFLTGASVILGTNTKLMKEADRTAMNDFLKQENLRVLPLPDLERLGDQGWSFTREMEATGLIQSALTAEDIQNKRDIALDLQSVLQQWVQRPVDFSELYFFLPFEMAPDDIKEAIMEKITDKSKDVYAWFMELVRSLKPIEPQDPTEQMEQRRKVLWSV